MAGVFKHDSLQVLCCLPAQIHGLGFSNLLGHRARHFSRPLPPLPPLPVTSELVQPANHFFNFPTVLLMSCDFCHRIVKKFSKRCWLHAGLSSRLTTYVRTTYQRAEMPH